MNDEMLRNELDLIEEKREQALIKLQGYQGAATRYYNSKVKERRFSMGKLVLRHVFQNTTESNASKLGTNWEGPYRVTNVLKPGVYELETLSGVSRLHSWNADHHYLC